jgi:HEAT repeat protein
MGRISAAHGLGDVGDARAVVPLVRCLQANDQLLRVSALKALAKIGEASAASAVFDVASSDDSFGVRVTAAETLARLGDPRSVALLGSLLLEEKGQYSRSFPKWAAKLLVELDGFEAIPQLEAVRRQSRPLTRLRLRRAIRTLRVIEGKRVRRSP